MVLIGRVRLMLKTCGCGRGVTCRCDALVKFLSLKPTEDYVPTADEIALAEDGSDW